MAEQVRDSKGKSSKSKKAAEAEELETTKTPEKEKTEQELKDELDALLDSIDEALGENLESAQDFVNNFIQKGGQLSRTFVSRVKEGFVASLPSILFKMRYLP